MKMYEMVNNYKQVQNLFETDELTEQDVADTREFILAELEEKGAGLIFVNTEFETELQKIKELEDMLKAKKKSVTNNQKRFKDMVKTTMEELDVKSIKTPLGTVSLRKGVESLQIEDETLIPTEYQIVEIKLDKTTIKSDLKDGKDISGASLVTGESSLSMPKPKFNK